MRCRSVGACFTRSNFFDVVIAGDQLSWHHIAARDSVHQFNHFSTTSIAYRSARHGLAESYVNYLLLLKELGMRGYEYKRADFMLTC
jgi:hypothetical protein